MSAPACAPPPCCICPALVLSEQINQVIQAVNKIGLAVRGLYGEGTEAMGNLFQVSNQTTLGETEDEIISRLSKVIEQIIEQRNTRATVLLQKSRRCSTTRSAAPTAC